MANTKKIVLSTFGSFGDVHPYIAIALELKARGHAPLIATSEVYREKMEAAGIPFHPVRPDMPSHDQPEDLIRLAEDLVDPRGGTGKVMELFTRDLEPVYEDLNAAVEGADLLLTHPLPLVGPIVAQKRKLPWISSVLAPVSFLSVYDPPVPPQMPSLYHLLKLSPLVGRILFRMGTYKFDHMVEPVYKLRAKLGLPRGGQPLMAGQHSPEMVLALFSSVLAKPQRDWPPNTRVTGFSFYDRRDYFGEAEMDPALVEFLRDGPPPLVFTLGSSAFWVAKDFYHDSIKAAQAVGRRAILLIGHQRNLPKEPLPEGIAAFEYAPFSQLLPRASAVVHSGGVGSTGQALRAGRPQLVVPHAHDQFDNAARVARIGCGRTIHRESYNAESAGRELAALLGAREYFETATAIGEQVSRENGAGAAAAAIEEMLKLQVEPELDYVAGY